jgi:5'-nucleotidase
MKRREFIKNTAAAGSLVGLGGLSMSAISLQAKKHITILHTNDVHSHIEPFPSNDPKYAHKGGIARRLSLIKSVRKENPNTLLLDAGDMFQGTPYFNFYGGELEFKLMSKLGYDAATIGNHDFDNAIDGLAAQMPHAQFELLTANYDMKNTIMEGLTKPYKVFVKDGVRVGVFGLGIKLNGLVNKRMYKETVYLDPIEIAQDMTATLRDQEHCDLVICLSHLGYDYRNKEVISDLNLAKATSGIDLIIGGHTHTFLEKPTLAQNKKGDFVLINQVGWGGIQLGRVDFYFDGTEKANKAVYYNI